MAHWRRGREPRVGDWERQWTSARRDSTSGPLFGPLNRLGDFLFPSEVFSEQETQEKNPEHAPASHRIMLGFSPHIAEPPPRIHRHACGGFSASPLTKPGGDPSRTFHLQGLPAAGFPTRRLAARPRALLSLPPSLPPPAPQPPAPSARWAAEAALQAAAAALATAHPPCLELRLLAARPPAARPTNIWHRAEPLAWRAR